MLTKNQFTVQDFVKISIKRSNFLKISVRRSKKVKIAVFRSTFSCLKGFKDQNFVQISVKHSKFVKIPFKKIKIWSKFQLKNENKGKNMENGSFCDRSLYHHDGYWQHYCYDNENDYVDDSYWLLDGCYGRLVLPISFEFVWNSRAGRCVTCYVNDDDVVCTGLCSFRLISDFSRSSTSSPTDGPGRSRTNDFFTDAKSNDRRL